MGKKLTANSKAVEAKERKAEAKSSAAAKGKQQEEEAEWAAHANPKHKRDSKKEDEERRRLETIAKKAETRRLAQEEEAAMAKAAAKKKAPPPKVTSHQLALQAEADRKQREKDAAVRALEQKRVVTEEEYEAQVVVDNDNREAAAVEARSLDAALEQLSVAEGMPGDRHPEKRAKAAWEEYYAEQLPIMKEDKPGLKLMQYKNRIFEQWQKDPRNPRNVPRP